MNRLAKKTYADGSAQSYGYAGGRLGGSRDARNRLTNFAYDANGNLSGIDYPNQTDVALTYNALDKPLTMSDGLGVTAFGYDNAGRLTSTDGPWANDTLTYGYDAEGRRSALGVQLPGGASDNTSYGYDALGRLNSLTSSAGSFGYSYQGNTGRIAQLLMPNGAKTTYSYTALGELDVLQNVAANNSNISRYDYQTDARGVRTQLQEQIEADPVKTLMFSYDVTNQLTGEQVTGGKAGEAYTSTYAYDAAGNRTRFEKASSTKNEVTRTSGNKLNQTLASTTATNGGAPLTAGYSYDAAGNMAQATSATGRSDYAFDDASRLVSIINRNGAGAALSKSEFAYDGMSRLRISRDFDWVGGAWVARGEKWRLYDGMNAVQERDGTGALVATYTRGQDMGGGIGGLLCRTFDGGKSFMHYDGRGNVVQLSDASGAVSGKYVYDAFGNTLSVSGGAAGLNSYRFSTKEQIGGLVYYGYRFYSPGMGKWINRDPIEEKGGNNLYGFVDNNPLEKIDYHGHVSQIMAGAIGAVANATGNIIGQIISNMASGQGALCIDWWSVGVAAIVGFISGFFLGKIEPSQVLPAIYAAVGAVSNIIQYATELAGKNYLNGNNILSGFSTQDAITAGLAGAVGGMAGSAGAFLDPKAGLQSVDTIGIAATNLFGGTIANMPTSQTPNNNKPIYPLCP